MSKWLRIHACAPLLRGEERKANAVATSAPDPSGSCEPNCRELEGAALDQSSHDFGDKGSCAKMAEGSRALHKQLPANWRQPAALTLDQDGAADLPACRWRRRAPRHREPRTRYA